MGNKTVVEVANKDFQMKMAYTLAVYKGIAATIEFESTNGWIDRTEELTYIVERYGEEHILSASCLREQLEEYKKIVSSRE